MFWFSRCKNHKNKDQLKGSGTGCVLSNSKHGPWNSIVSCFCGWIGWIGSGSNRWGYPYHMDHARWRNCCCCWLCCCWWWYWWWQWRLWWWECDNDILAIHRSLSSRFAKEFLMHKDRPQQRPMAVASWNWPICCDGNLARHSSRNRQIEARCTNWCPTSWILPTGGRPLMCWNDVRLSDVIYSFPKSTEPIVALFGFAICCTCPTCSTHLQVGIFAVVIRNPIVWGFELHLM